MCRTELNGGESHCHCEKVLLPSTIESLSFNAILMIDSVLTGQLLYINRIQGAKGLGSLDTDPISRPLINS